MRIRKFIVVLLFSTLALICTGCVFKESVKEENTVTTSERHGVLFESGKKIIRDSYQATTKYYETTSLKTTTTTTQTTTCCETTKANQFSQGTKESLETTILVNTFGAAPQIATTAEFVTNAEEYIPNIVETNTVITEIVENLVTEAIAPIKQEPVEIVVTPTVSSIPEPTESEIRDALIIDDDVIEIFYGPADQKNVDEHDVVQDTGVWSNSRSTFFFGHNYGSFRCLKYVTVGKTISVINNGIEKKYVVTRSEKGILTDDQMDIEICSDGAMFVHDDFGYEDIRLSTCIGGLSQAGRWIVVAQLVN